ncbi:MAG: DUF4919 domain-containing protein, partial [Candidatus Latescibacterota bacterium]
KSFFEFVENPTGAHYRTILDNLAATPEYRPYAGYIEQIQGLLDSEDYEKAYEACQRSKATLLLSPELHMLAGYAAREMGDDELFNLERVITSACVRGILDTGDGTKDEPYVVSVTGDEYFILEVLKKTFESQELVEDGDRYMDLIKTTDGTEIYFDITKPYQNLQKQLFEKSDDTDE